MRIGDLNKRIELQSATRTSDSMGGYTEVWATEVIVWAAIWPLSANETIQALQTVMSITHRIRIRYRDDIRSTWRIKFGTRYFSIISMINPNEKNATLDLMCKEAS